MHQRIIFIMCLKAMWYSWRTWNIIYVVWNKVIYSVLFFIALCLKVSKLFLKVIITQQMYTHGKTRRWNSRLIKASFTLTSSLNLQKVNNKMFNNIFFDSLWRANFSLRDTFTFFTWLLNNIHLNLRSFSYFFSIFLVKMFRISFVQLTKILHQEFEVNFKRSYRNILILLKIFKIFN